MNAQTEILARIAAAKVPPIPAPRSTVTPSGRSREEVVNQFAEYAEDYKATVVRCDAEVVQQKIALLVQGERTVVPADFPGFWEPEGAIIDHGLSIAELDGIEAVVTLCAVAIAETGTVVLDHGPGQGRRAITLVPDHHIVLVPESLIVDSVPEAVEMLAEAAMQGRPMTWISGPSATSDIELSRVEGVHGPRRLDIVIVDL
ncbi:lactate utilization protein C [soil metagenome]